MENNTFYNEILIEHNMHPLHKHALDNPDIVLQGKNPSCGDDITLELKLKDGIITDGAFVGEGCAISQASADIMLDLIIGKKKDEALELADDFIGMIQKTATEEQIDKLEEASILRSVSDMPARVKCAVLGWRTLKEIGQDGK